MSDEVSQEVVEELNRKKVYTEDGRLTSEKRVEISIAASRFIRDMRKYEEAVNNMRDSEAELELALEGVKDDVVVKVDYVAYLVGIDEFGDCSAEKIEFLG